MSDRPYSPPASRSGELDLIQEAIRVAVQSTIASLGRTPTEAESCRQELDAIKAQLRTGFGEMREEFKEVRAEVAVVRSDLADGKTEFALLNQRLDMEKETRDKEERARENREVREKEEQRVRERSPSKGTRVSRGPTDPDEKPLVSPKVWNALILAVATAAGASIWAAGAAWLAPKADPPAKVASAPVLAPPASGTATASTSVPPSTP